MLLLVPALILAVGVGGPRLAASLSAMSFMEDGVAVRNFPHRTQRIPISVVNRFDSVANEGIWSQVRFVRVQLLLNDGSRLIVRAAGDPEDGVGMTALNNRLEEMRTSLSS